MSVKNIKSTDSYLTVYTENCRCSSFKMGIAQSQYHFLISILSLFYSLSRYSRPVSYNMPSSHQDNDQPQTYLHNIHLYVERYRARSCTPARPSPSRHRTRRHSSTWDIAVRSCSPSARRREIKKGKCRCQYLLQFNKKNKMQIITYLFTCRTRRRHCPWPRPRRT